jgi:hypothetical protein
MFRDEKMEEKKSCKTCKYFISSYNVCGIWMKALIFAFQGIAKASLKGYCEEWAEE